jgi:ATP-dependent Lon protease
MTITLALETAEAREAVDASSGAGDQILLVPRVGRGQGPEGGRGSYARVGTVASVDRTGKLPGGTPAVVVTGLHRASLGAATAVAGAALWVEIDPITDPAPSQESLDAAIELRVLFEAIAEHRGINRLAELFRGIDDPGRLADLAGYWPELSLERKIELLETTEPGRRVDLVLAWARETLAELELRDRIRSDVAEGMERTQREFLLRQQMAAIRKELGETGDAADGDEIAEFRARLESLVLTDEVRATLAREIDKLERTPEQSPERSWIRAWLDTMFEMPWGHRSVDRLDLTEARSVLDGDHTGLDRVKERIIEHLAVRKLRRDRGEAQGDAYAPDRSARGDGMILALVGPPGVGKTSLGESISRAMGRRFVRVALGGIHDEAEIRGHRRTYVGAMPGRIARAIRDAGTLNPVVLLDEVDKLGSDWRGDPSAALLEVLDPAQNHTFRDHYLDVDLDLSEVLFLATANTIEQIPGPLLDRMEVVRLDGYTEAEKVAIARDHLVARQMARVGLLEGELCITDEALGRIVADYTREAGVRGLERELGRLMRKAATKVAQGDGTESPSRLTVDSDDVHSWLGRPRFSADAAQRTSTPGVATGLAVTGAGGDVLFVEASASEGQPGLIITGQLGDVMQESAQIAVSYARAHSGDLGVGPDVFEHRVIHLHVPAGAVPKDGPSAGVTMTTAVVSLLSGRPVRPEVGMTGEMTLQGRVLPIGGVKQKVLAAHRAGLTEVILPARNADDLEDVPDSVREAMIFHFASQIDEVLKVALEEKILTP